MKRTISLLLLVSIMLFSNTVAAKEKTFGKGVSLKEETKVSEILENPEDFVGKRILINGLVVKVCPMRGCWINVASDKGHETIRVKVLDGEIVFPMDIKGHEALVEGVVYKMEYDEDGKLIRNTSDLPEHQKQEHKHQEGGDHDDKSEAHESHTEEKAAKVIYQIRGIGAVVK